MIFSYPIHFETPYGDDYSNNHQILRPKRYQLVFVVPTVIQVEDLKYFIQFSPVNKGFRNMF